MDPTLFPLLGRTGIAYSATRLPLPAGFGLRFDEGVTSLERDRFQNALALAREYLGDSGPVVLIAATNMDNLLQLYSQEAGIPVTSRDVLDLKDSFLVYNYEAIVLNNIIIVWVNDRYRKKPSNDILYNIVHEYFHTMQYRFVNYSSSPQWLSEGSADFWAYRVLVYLGLDNYQSIRKRIAAQANQTPNLLAATEKVKPGDHSPYALGFMATEFLIKNYGEDKVYPTYWRFLGHYGEWKKTFSLVFDAPENFYKAFEEYRQKGFPPYPSIEK